MMSFHGHHHGHEHRPGPAQQRGHQSLDKWQIFILATPEFENRNTDNTVSGHDKLVMTDASVLHNLDKSTLRCHLLYGHIETTAATNQAVSFSTFHDVKCIHSTGFAIIRFIPLHVCRIMVDIISLTVFTLLRQ